MSRIVFLIFPLALAVSACAKKEPTTETQVSEPVVVTDFTLTKKCADGTDIYQITGGDYATWDGQNGQWIKLSPGVTPNDFCS